MSSRQERSEKPAREMFLEQAVDYVGALSKQHGHRDNPQGISSELSNPRVLTWTNVEEFIRRPNGSYRSNGKTTVVPLDKSGTFMMCLDGNDNSWGIIVPE